MFYDLVILDLDGVIADQRCAATGVLNYLAAEDGLSTVPASAVDQLEDRTAAGLASLLPLSRWRRKYLAYRLGRLLGTCTDAIRMHAGMEAAILWLCAADLEVAVVSSWPMATVRDVLGEALSSAVDHIEAGHPWGGRRRQLARVLTASGMRPHRCLYVGDRGEDGETARLLGLNFGAVAWGRMALKPLLDTLPDEVFGQPAEFDGLTVPCHCAAPIRPPALVASLQAA